MYVLIAAFLVTQADPSALSGVLESVSSGMSLYGWIGGLAAVLSGLVAAFRMLAPGWWKKLPSLAKRGLVFAFAGAGAGLLSWLGDVGLMPAISAGVVAGLSAIGIHQNAKALKKAVVSK